MAPTVSEGDVRISADENRPFEVRDLLPLRRFRVD